MTSTITSPISSPPSSRGRLLVLGGLGLQPGFTPVWKELLSWLPTPPPTVSVLLLAKADHSPVLEQRVSLSEEVFSNLGIPTQAVGRPPQPSDALSEAAMSLSDGVCAFLLTDESLTSLPSLLQTRAESPDALPLWDAVWKRHHAGMPVIATAGVAAVLGQHAFTPMRPYPPTLEALAFECLPGFGIFEGAAILPYFDRFPEGLLDKLERLFPAGTILIGIDEQAALVSGADAWQVAGLGNVSILIHNQVALVAEAGASIPGNLLTPYG